MARSVNQVFLLGNLTRDLDPHQTPSGQSVCSFSLALNRAYKGQNGDWQEATDYVDCVAWGPLAERMAQYLSKGSRVLVQGRLQSRSWEQEGQRRSKVEVLANDVTFVGGRGSDSGSAGSSSYAPSDDSSNGGGSAPAQPGSGSSKKQDDDVVEDVGDEPINLDDIPF